jgi:hypothetical protein
MNELKSRYEYTDNEKIRNYPLVKSFSCDQSYY